MLPRNKSMSGKEDCFYSHSGVAMVTPISRFPHEPGHEVTSFLQNHSSRFHKEKLVIYLGCVKFMGHLCITDLGLFEVDKPLFIINKVDKL